MDIMTPAQRSGRMSLIRSKNTKPEMAVRRLVHSLGFRYRLHAPDLPGRPDIIFRKRQKVIFVHGCFWHMHARCCRPPKSKLSYWKPKLEGNVERDKRVRRQLRKLGWSVLVLWECEIEDTDGLSNRITAFLEG